MADNKFIHDNGCKEAVCVDAGRVYDSCSEEDCTRYIHRWGTAFHRTPGRHFRVISNSKWVGDHPFSL